MRKFTVILLLVVLCSVVFCSCRDDDLDASLSEKESASALTEPFAESESSDDATSDATESETESEIDDGKWTPFI